MNIIYLSPNGFINPHLFPTFKKTFERYGHTETNDPYEATHCFIELVSGDAKYDKTNMTIVMDRNIPIIYFDDREYGTMNGTTLTTYVTDNPSIYFIRNFSKDNLEYENFYPFDWPYFPQCDFQPTTKEELFSREFDVCLLSVESPARKKVIDSLINDGRLKVNYKWLDHTQRFPYNQWLDEHRKAKLYISCEGGGFTNERPNQLFAIAPMLKVNSDYLPAHPFTDGINCVEVEERSTEEDIEKILDIINHKEWLYDIYINGIEHTKRYMSEEATAKYVLDKIQYL